jgi:hypothetical protein
VDQEVTPTASINRRKSMTVTPLDPADETLTDRIASVLRQGRRIASGLAEDRDDYQARKAALLAELRAGDEVPL